MQIITRQISEQEHQVLIQALLDYNPHHDPHLTEDERREYSMAYVQLCTDLADNPSTLIIVMAED